MVNSDRSVLNELRSTTTKALRDVLGGERNVAVLDFPGHMNVGDSMIWAGEMAYMRSLNINVRYACDIERFSTTALKRAHPQGAILLHGGGNLGDIWPRFQDFREKIVREFPDRKIVQLPQTLYFNSKEKAAQANRVFGQHKDFTLLLRDNASIERARQYLPSVETLYAPDMALGWSPDTRPSASTRGILLLARQDSEAKGDLANLQAKLSVLTQVEVADWGLTGPSLATWKATRIPGGLVRRFEYLHDVPGSNWLLEKAYETMLRMNLRAGITGFKDRSLIVTDRLHAHVLAALMGIPHVVLDNSYGKVGSIFGDYTGEFGSAHFARDEAEALQISHEILG